MKSLIAAVAAGAAVSALTLTAMPAEAALAKACGTDRSPGLEAVALEPERLREREAEHPAEPTVQCASLQIAHAQGLRSEPQRHAIRPCADTTMRFPQPRPPACVSRDCPCS